jgi:hypothetical protein
MKTLKNLLNLIETESINNKCTITNVDLFVKSWRREMDAEFLQSCVVGQSEQLGECNFCNNIAIKRDNDGFDYCADCLRA